MNQDVNKRIDDLELQVKALQEEMRVLKGQQQASAPIIQQVTHKGQENLQPKPIPEKPLTKIFFPNASTTQEEAKQPVPQQSQPLPPVEKQPRKSLEETFLNVLPKIFMVILVLGVLWGLKLASDYGYLADSVKIAAGYVLAIALAVAAYMLEKKKQKTDNLIISLYGGAFMVGILTTAAGAILYDVLGLMVALAIALIFIAYGVAISYFKKNEALTVFIAFTSLLLPYLLEYMDFNKVIIAVYVVLIYLVLQVVIIKHVQKWSLYVATFFSMIVPLILASNESLSDIVLSFALITVLAVFYFSWWKICSDDQKYKPVHVTILFALNSYTLMELIFVWSLNQIPLYIVGVLLVLQLVVLYFAHSHSKRELFDIMAASIVLTILTALISIDMNTDKRLLLMVLASFVGLMVGLRLRVAFTKLINGGIFILLAAGIYAFYSIDSFMTITNLTLLLIPALLYVAYLYAKRPKEKLDWYEKAVDSIYLLQLVPVAVFLFIWAYISKFNFAYQVFKSPDGYYTNSLAEILIAFVLLAALTLSAKWVGKVLPVIALVIFVGKSLYVMTDSWGYVGIFEHLLITRAVFFVITVLIILDIWKKGLIYRNFEEGMEEFKQPIVIGIIIWLITYVFGNTSFFHDHDKISWNVAVMLNTFMIFISAVVALLLGRKHSMKNVTIFGILLLCFGFIKMIFFDLSNLDLFIRSILFIVVGGVGLIVSNRLMKK